VVGGGGGGGGGGERERGFAPARALVESGQWTSLRVFRLDPVYPEYRKWVYTIRKIRCKAQMIYSRKEVVGRKVVC
jgi:hypothetical protein